MENKRVDTKGEMGWHEMGDRDWHTHIIDTAYKIAKENWLYISEMLLNALWWPKWEGNPKKEGSMYIHM